MEHQYRRGGDGMNRGTHHHPQARCEGVLPQELRGCSGYSGDAETVLLLPLLGKTTKHTGVVAVTPAELRGHLIEMLRLVLGSGSDEECSVCLDCPSARHHTLCTQVYCRLCSAEVISTEQEQTRCPLCRGQINANELVEFPQEEEEEEEESNLSENWRSSSKVEAVISSLLRLHSEENSIKSQKQDLVEKAFGFPRERKN